MFSKKQLLVAFSLVSLALPYSSFAVDKAMFEKGGEEYHFILNDITHIDEKFMPTLPTEVIEKLSPMFIIEPNGKSGNGMYVDTPDRKLQNKNLILRVKKGSITVKARADNPKDIVDLPICERPKSVKEYEIDYFKNPEYSISSMIKLEKEDLDLAKNKITISQVNAFFQKECAQLHAYVKDVLEDPTAVIPGIVNQYAFKAKIGKGYPLADNKDLEVDFSVWFFPTAKKSIIELSFTGPIEEKAKLEKLQEQTFAFLKEKGLLSTKQVAKTETYFDIYLSKK